MQTWKQIKREFNDMWIAMDKWEESAVGDVIKGEVIYHAKNRKTFYSFIRQHFSNKDLAIRYTGKISVPFFLTK